MRKKGQINIGFGIMILALIVTFYIIIEISEDKIEQKLEEKLFNTCLNGCAYYEQTLRNKGYDDLYFDYCANDCNDGYWGKK